MQQEREYTRKPGTTNQGALDVSSPALANFEMLVVSNDYPMLRMFARACSELGARSDSTASIIAAEDMVKRRKVDGIVVDMRMVGAFDLIENIRSGSSNRSALIFACTESHSESESALNAGANLLVKKPIDHENLVALLSASAPMLDEERRRYFRHQLVIPITISRDGVPHRALTSNMSQSGMAIRSFRTFDAGTPVEFSFVLPSGPSVKGRGEVMWIDAEGRIGVKFLFLCCTGDMPLSEWLDHHCMVMS